MNADSAFSPPAQFHSGSLSNLLFFWEYPVKSVTGLCSSLHSPSSSPLIVLSKANIVHRGSIALLAILDYHLHLHLHPLLFSFVISIYSDDIPLQQTRTTKSHPPHLDWASHSTRFRARGILRNLKRQFKELRVNSCSIPVK